MIRLLVGALAGLVASVVAPISSVGPAIADPGCEQYNDRGVCVITVEIPGDKKPEKPPSGDSKDKAPELPDCASFPKASDSPPDDPTGWVQVGCMEGSIPITLWVEGGASA